MLCGVIQDGQVMVERSDRMWSTGEGNGEALQYSCLEIPMNSMKRQNDRILKEELPRSVGAQYATGDQWRNNSKKNEGMEPRQKQYQLWVWLVIEARSYAVKAILHRNLECQVHKSRQIGSGQTGDGKSEHQHSRNQRTKMDWNAKVGSQETPGVTGKFGLEIRNEAGKRLIEFCQENALVIAPSSNNTREDSIHGHHQMVNTEIR